MKLETFFDKFGELADAPDAMAKIRQLVLDLALNGSVIGLDASKWDRVSLGSLGEWGSGGTPLRSEPQYFGGSIPWLVIGDLNDGVVTSASSTITEEGLANSSARLLPKGVLLIAMYGSIGKMGITGIECATNQAIAFCKPDPKRTDLRYLFHTLKGIQPALLARGHGLAQKNISQTILKAWEINLPPIVEQKRIVAKVDELMALCDRLEAQQQERETKHAALARAALARFADASTAANLPFLFHPSYAIPPADLRKSILTLAVQGKLVPQDPNDEPAEASSESESLFEIPTSWQWKRLGTLGLCRTGRTPPTSDPSNYGSGFPFVGPGQITPSGKFTVSEKTITSKGLENSTEAKASDILMVCIGGSIGKAGICREPLGFNQQINSVRLRRDLPEFVYLAFTAEYFQEQVLANASGSATPIINKGKWERIPVPIPPLAEQRRIVAKVEQLMALVDALETQLAASRATAANLLSALVAELTGNEGALHPTGSIHKTASMKSKPDGSSKRRSFAKPLEMSTRSFVLRRFAMSSGYRSLDKFDRAFHEEPDDTKEASPICLVGLNGSGKSNFIEAIAEVFCFLELINTPWQCVSSESSTYRKNRHIFELEYLLEDAHGKRLIRITKTNLSKVDFWIVDEDGNKTPVEPGRDQISLLPRRIIGYSSGLNETVSHPFLRTKTLYSQEVGDAAPPKGEEPPEDDSVYDSRTLYMDYESNEAVIISNFIFHKPEALSDFAKHTRVCGVTSFGLHFNRKRAGKSGEHRFVRLTTELKSCLQRFCRCAGVPYDEEKIEYDLHFPITPETVSRFRGEFKTADDLFMAMHKWSLLNALILSDDQRKVYLSSDVTKGALERPPSVPPSDRVFNISGLKLKLTEPAIEIDYSGLSDGEHQFIQVFGTVLLFGQPGTLFLFDEPESHFNPEWRTKFNMILNALPHASRQEYIISTHSPFIVSGSRKSNVYKFTRNGAEITFAAVPFETYGASFDVLLKKLFSISSLIDQSARQDLAQIIKRGKADEMEAAVENFAESKEKRRLYEAIIKNQEAQ